MDDCILEFFGKRLMISAYILQIHRFLGLLLEEICQFFGGGFRNNGIS